MKHRLISCSVIAVAMIGVLSLFLLSMPAAQDGSGPVAKRAADNQATPNRPTPRTADGHVDFSGFYNDYEVSQDPTAEYGALRSDDGNILYQHIGVDEAQQHVPPSSDYTNAAPYKPEYLAKVKAIAATAYGGTTALDPQMDCTPMGIPRGGIGTMQIVQSPGLIAILYEKNPGYLHRIIYMDGRGHPKDLDTSPMGDSIGHWEGDTLVVDVTGLDDETWLDGGQGHANLSTIHSDKEHVIERWTRNGDTITYNATVEDPVMFTRPWVILPKHIKIAPKGDYMQALACSHTDNEGRNRKVHMVQETEKDKFLCGWCQLGSVYGEASDKPTTGQDVPDVLKEGLKTKTSTTNSNTK